MKISSVLYTLLFLLTLLVPASAQFDDIYFNPEEDEDYFAVSRNTYSYNDYEYEEEDGYDQNDRYYDDYDDYDTYYDFYYTSRIRRFHRPYYGFGFFANPYVDLFYYDPFYFDPFRPTVSIYLSTFSYNPWNPWNQWNYNPYFNTGFGNNFFFNNYYGYNPYYNYYPYHNFGPPSYWNYSDEFYGNTQDYYYGPRNSGHGRTQPVSRINRYPIKTVTPDQDEQLRSRESDRSRTPAATRETPDDSNRKSRLTPGTKDKRPTTPRTRTVPDTRRSTDRDNSPSLPRTNNRTRDNNYNSSRQGPTSPPSYQRSTSPATSPSTGGRSGSGRSTSGRSRGGN